MLQPGMQGAVLVNQASLKAKRDAIKLNPQAIPPAPAPGLAPAPAGQPASPGAASAARLIDPSKPAAPLPRNLQPDDAPAAPDAGGASPAPAAAQAPQVQTPPAQQTVMPSRRHTSYKLSLPTPQQQ